ncbi:MAG: TRAP transporter small permease [Clostridiales bacterium]|nr:TRAP transporter small permease [Clostridiales bacterium]MDO5140485.1 TRAP transporter small permease [Eubacteriales bacterium]
MKQILSCYSGIMDVIEKILRCLIGIAMAVMVAVIFYQVVLRYVFNNSNIWSEELARYLMCYVVLFGAAIAIRKGSHLQVDFLINMLPERARSLAVIACTIAGDAFLVFFFIHGISLVQGTFKSISSGTGIPMAYAYMCLPIGAVLMVMASIEVILKEADSFIESGKEKKR